MNAKTKALLLNFACFVSIFLIFRLGLPSIGLRLPHIPLLVISAVAASFLAPKFAVRQKDGKEVLIMKSLFKKEPKELN
jgi:hypothetical protein